MSGGATERVEVAVVGGGLAGAATGALLAGLGHEVVVLERAPRWRWRACGVFASPAGVTALRRLGLTDVDLLDLAEPVPAMRVESRRGVAFRLTYDGTGRLADSPVGFDREALDESLLERARRAGARVERGAAVDAVDIEGPHPRLTLAATAHAAPQSMDATVVVGADGLRSIVARGARADARVPNPGRTALTFHVPAADAGAAPGSDARMVVLDDGYVGLAPVPGGRLNVGIVLGRSWQTRIRDRGAASVAAEILAGATGRRTDTGKLAVLDRVAGVRPVSAAVERRAGDGWLVVGDAAGFLDPFTGEGIHRALVSADLAAGVIHDALTGRPGARLTAYDAAMGSRFGTKDLVSRLVQAFLGRPAMFEYTARRLAARQGIRDTMGRVIGDLEPARHALDPRFLAALLAP
ncbi:MAG TPA: NAD(P)/FAD-dependent oxidoreductase [Candidatus Limnocylindrales bacterium]|nr:NAD(P)/FAD-dependent oxidoreductase [Candidatus Limnocylindrales bacterium]